MLRKLIFNLINKLGFVTIGKLMAFISVPIISRALGPEKYGVYNLVFAIAGYAFLAANWGFMAKGIRDIAKSTNDKYKLVEPIISSRLTLWWIGGGITMLICILIFKENNLIFYIFLGILSNLGLALSIDFYFYGKKDTFIPSLSSLIGQVIFILLVWLFIENENDLFKLMLINIFYRLVEASIMLLLFRKKHKLNLTFLSNKAIPLLKENFYLGLGAKASFFQSSFPLIIIPILLSVYELGVFSAAFKLFIIISLLVQSINLVFSPWIVESKQQTVAKRGKLFRNLLIGYGLIGIISSVLLFNYGPNIMSILFGDKFIESQDLIIQFSIILAPILPIQLLLSNYMNNFESDKHFFIGSLLQSILTLIGIPVFIYFYDLNGAIYGLGLANSIVILYYYFNLKKTLNLV